MRAGGKALTLVAGLMLLTACSSTPQAAGTAPEPGPVTLRVLSMNGTQVLEPVIAAFDAGQQEIRVELATVSFRDMDKPDFAKRKLETDEIDLVSVEPGMLQEDLLLPLDSLIQKAGFNLKPLGPVPQALRFDGKLYELPYAVQPDVLLYNQDLADRAGVKLPTEPPTWDEFRSLARQLSSAGVQGFNTFSPEGMLFLWLREKHPDGNVTTQDLREALQFFSTLIFTDKSMPPSQARPSTAPSSKETIISWMNPDYLMIRTDPAFEEGKVAVTASLLLALQGLRDGKFPVGVSPVPTFPGAQSAAPAQVFSFGIPANSRHVQAAWQFLRFVAGPDGQAVLARQGVLPAYMTDDVRKAWLEQTPAPPSSSVSLLHSNWLVAPRGGKTASDRAVLPDKVRELANQVFSGQKSVDAAMAGWAAETK